jgi:hypothetical protein
LGNPPGRPLTVGGIFLLNHFVVRTRPTSCDPRISSCFALIPALRVTPAYLRALHSSPHFVRSPHIFVLCTHPRTSYDPRISYGVIGVEPLRGSEVLPLEKGRLGLRRFLFFLLGQGCVLFTSCSPLRLSALCSQYYFKLRSRSSLCSDTLEKGRLGLRTILPFSRGSRISGRRTEGCDLFEVLS